MSVYDKASTPYDNLVRALQENDYEILDDGFEVSRFSKNLTIGAFAPPHAEGSIFQNKVLAEHVDAFNKWSQAPVVLTIPCTQEEMDRLLGLLEWVGTDEGFTVSNSFIVEKWVHD